MRPSKILNLVAFGFDLIVASLLVFVAAQLILHTLDQANSKAFDEGTRQVRGNYNDFRTYYALGRIAESSERANLMEVEVQRQWFCSVSTPSGADCSGYRPNPYLPFFSVAWMLIAKLPLNVAYVAWSIAGVIAFTSSLFALARTSIPRGSMIAAILIPVFAIASIPGWRCVVIGQCSFVIGALLALYFVSWIRRWDLLAGGFIALASFKPHFIIPMLIPALVKTRLRILVSFAIAEVVLLGLSIAILGPKPLLDWVSANARHGSTNWDDIWTMLSLSGIYSYLPQPLSTIAIASTFVAGCAIIAWCWKRGTDSYWLIASTICVGLLTSYSQLYDAILLAVPAAVTLYPAGARNLFSGDWRTRLWWGLLYLYPAITWFVWLGLGRYNHISYHAFTAILFAQSALAVSLALRPPAANPDVPAVAESPR